MTAKEQINRDILEAAWLHDKDFDMFIKEYIELLPPSFNFQCEEEVPPIVQAWMALQIEQGSSLRYHKSKDLGEFIYDYNMYNVHHWIAPNNRYRLQYVKNSMLRPDIPDGLISCAFMFENFEFPEDFIFGEKFNTSRIENMYEMFALCKFPRGFRLSPGFNITKVKDTSFIFDNCTLDHQPLLGTTEEIIAKLSILNFDNPASHNIILKQFTMEEVDEFLTTLKGDDYTPGYYNTTNTTAVANIADSLRKFASQYSIHNLVSTKDKIKSVLDNWPSISSTFEYHAALEFGRELHLDKNNPEHISFLLWLMSVK